MTKVMTKVSLVNCFLHKFDCTTHCQSVFGGGAYPPSLRLPSIINMPSTKYSILRNAFLPPKLRPGVAKHPCGCYVTARSLLLSPSSARPPSPPISPALPAGNVLTLPRVQTSCRASMVPTLLFYFCLEACPTVASVHHASS